MRRAWAWLLLVLWAGPAMAQGRYQVEVVASQPHGLLYFLQSLRGEAHHSAYLAQLFRQRRGSHPEDEQAIQDFRQLLESTSWGRTRFPGDHRQRKLDDVLEVMAVHSRDLGEFLLQSQAVLDLEDQQRLARACQHFAPLYQSLVWEPCRSYLEERARGMRQEMERTGFAEALRAAGLVYGSAWPLSRPFTVALVPIPREGSAKGLLTFGHSDGFLEVIEMVQGRDKGDLGVVFHELCHSLWNTRPQEKSLEAAFQKAGGAWAYGELNEGLATALGNGWFDERARGSLNRESWYADPVIDGVAHALYPLLKPYLEEGRPLDASFATQAVTAIASALPRAERDVRIALRQVLVLSPHSEVAEGGFQNQLMGLGPMHSVTVCCPPNLERRRQEGTALYLLTPGEEARMAAWGWDPPAGP